MLISSPVLFNKFGFLVFAPVKMDELKKLFAELPP
jgi:hypothetical protein